VSSGVSDSSKSSQDINGSLCLGRDYDIKKAPALAVTQEINSASLLTAQLVHQDHSRHLGSRCLDGLGETDSLLGKRRHENERLTHSEHLGLKMSA
jgi:hypothetical protein